MYPPITYLSDCTDTNAQARLSTRMAALFGRSPVLLPLDGPAPEQTAGLTLLDVLLATRSLGEDGFPTVTLVNVAPRDGTWENGAPFCWFRLGPHTVFSTYDSRLLAMVRTHLDVTQVEVTDARTVLGAATAWADLSRAEADAVATTQFRSLWYLPLLAKWVLDGHPVPATTTRVPAVPEATKVRVGLVDNFGNCKLTATAEAVGFEPGSRLAVSFSRAGEDLGSHKVRCYERLAEVPAGEAGLVVGSSGSGFVELVVGCGSAAHHFGVVDGTDVEFP
ncbi:SAM hydroxide adenosyltransferase [Jiangella asiatica]|uniref:S-adenosyl-l-methionine hydroxide adenosyltransferase C-terminal domain-containing protein n=1 Tax=Jiangella asiatica TaxID=2530372 RepID=A0A4R5DNH8_9ACTN|nr:SAM hydroxide adenosyltransferase [Jiangella asiatica]TDE15882.1 hypothetical protein E1269_00890 [Jiangella asiatica]